jgi:hypothetical protein
MSLSLFGLVDAPPVPVETFWRDGLLSVSGLLDQSPVASLVLFGLVLVVALVLARRGFVRRYRPQLTSRQAAVAGCWCAVLASALFVVAWGFSGALVVVDWVIRLL